jgi:hypothetical protein
MLQKLQQLLQENQKDSTRDELSKMQMDNKSLKKNLTGSWNFTKSLILNKSLIKISTS